MDKNQKATLGCGTIILIALIVIIFGNMGGKDAAEQVRGLRQDVQKLEQAITIQTQEIDSLKQRISSSPGPTSTAPATQPE